MQETQVPSLIREDPTCCGAAESVGHNSWACTVEPQEPQLLSPRSTTAETWMRSVWMPVLYKRSPCSATREARALQQERLVLYKRSPCSATRKLSQWEASAPQPESSPHSLQTCAATKTQHSWKLINIYIYVYFKSRASLVAQTVKCLSAMQETWVRSLGWEDLLEKEMAALSSILAWKIPWTAEPGRLLSTGSQRVGHDWAKGRYFKSHSFWRLRRKYLPQ